MSNPGKPFSDLLLDDIVLALGHAGFSVLLISQRIGALLAGRNGVSFVLVVRSGKELTPAQLAWCGAWSGGFQTVATPANALATAQRLSTEIARLKPEELRMGRAK